MPGCLPHPYWPLPVPPLTWIAVGIESEDTVPSLGRRVSAGHPGSNCAGATGLGPLADTSGLTADLVPVSDQCDAESEDDSTDPQLSADGSELAILDGDDATEGHDGSHHYNKHEYCSASFHIETEATPPVNRILVTRQNGN